MSEILEKTIGSLQNTVGVSFDYEGIPGCMSRGFQNFIHLISSVKSKHAEEQLIRQEICLLQQRLAQPNNTPAQLKEFMLRLIYCEMLGYPVPFAYVHALKLAQQGSLLDKRIGYLAATLFLNEDSELVLLLVNTVQKDLKSSSIADNCMALTAICRLVNHDIISLLLPLVEEKVSHPREMVRKKAVITLHKMHIKTPYLIFNMKQIFGKILCDPDPSVMGVSLYILYDIVKADPKKWAGLIVNLTQVLLQILNQKLHHDYTYHNVPAPWLQIQILKLFALLGNADSKCDELLTEVLKKVLNQAEINHNIAYAVVFECIQTISIIPCHKELIDLASIHCGKFLRSSSNNLKYLGVGALSSLVTQIPVSSTQQHQAAVLQCLQHPDIAIRIKTLDLMYKMTNSKNVTVICKHMMNYLMSTTDDFIKISLASKLETLIWRFAPSKEWLLQSMAQLMRIRDISFTAQTVNNLLQVLSQDLDNSNLQIHATTTFNKLLFEDYCSTEVIQVAAWVLGEHGHLLEREMLDKFLQKLSVLFPSSGPAQTYVVSAFIKLVLQSDIALPSLKLPDPTTSVIQQIRELEQLLKNKKNNKIGGKLISAEEFDSSLTFLDGYVNQALQTGMGTYKPRHSGQFSKTMKTSESLLENFYYQPFETTSASGESSSRPMSVSSEGNPSADFNAQVELNVKSVPNVWSLEGLLLKQPLPIKVQSEPSDVAQDESQNNQDESSLEAPTDSNLQELSTALFSEDDHS